MTIAIEKALVTDHVSGGGSARRLGWTLAATSLGFVAVQLDVTIVNVALASMEAAFGSGVTGLQWIVDAYTLSFATLLLAAGAMGDRLGSRRVFTGGLALFGLASLACGMAPSVPLLIAARAAQGIGAALILPTSLALIAHACGGDDAARVRAIAWWSAAGGLSVAAGPVIGGFLVDAFGWRSIFLVNVPLCLLGMRLVAGVEETVKDGEGGRFDAAGLLIAIAALAVLTGSVIEAGPRGWSDPWVVGGLAFAAAAGIAFLVTEARSAAPMLPLHFCRRSTLSAGVAVGTLINLTYFGLIFLLSLYFQRVRGYSPALTGLAFLPLTAVTMLANIAGGWISAKAGFRAPMVAGLSLAAIGYGLLASLDAATPFSVIAWKLSLIPIGIGITSPAMTAAVIGSVERVRAGTASAVLNTARQVGGAVGVALFGAFTAGGSAEIASGLAHAFCISAIMLSVAAGMAALWVRKPAGEAR